MTHLSVLVFTQDCKSFHSWIRFCLRGQELGACVKNGGEKFVKTSNLVNFKLVFFILIG